MTNKAPVSPNRGYSRMQQLWFTERVIDIVAHDARVRPGRDPAQELRPARGHALRDAERLRLRLGRLPAGARHGARADRRRRRIEERRAEAASRGKLLGLGIGSTLDSGTNNFGQSQLINPDLQFSGQQRGRDGQARHLRRDRRHARHDAAGPEPRDDGRAGRRGHPRLRRRHGPRARRPRQLLELARGLLRAPTRASSPSRASAPSRAPPTCSRGEMMQARLDGVPVPRGGDRARRRLRPDQGQPRGGAAVHGARRDPEREQCRLPRGSADDELPLRLPAAVRGAGQGAEVRQPDADVRDADPRLRRRDRPGDRRHRGRRLRRRRRLRRPHQPADRRGPGDGRDRARDRRGAVGVVRLRRGRQPADARTSTTTTCPTRSTCRRSRPAAIESPSPFTPLGTKGMGEGGGGGIHCICAGDPGRAARRRRRDRDRQPQPLPPRLGAALATRSGREEQSR